MGTPEPRPRAVLDRLQEVIVPILCSLDLELVEVACVGQGPRSIVRVFIDKPGGVTVKDCERAHVALGPAVDVVDPFPHAYTLEVSSPGLDRPFKRLQDYRRAVGKQINVKLKQPLDGHWRLIGELLDVDEQAVVLAIAEERAAPKTVRLDHQAVAEARLVVKI